MSRQKICKTHGWPQKNDSFWQYSSNFCPPTSGIRNGHLLCKCTEAIRSQQSLTDPWVVTFLEWHPSPCFTTHSRQDWTSDICLLRLIKGVHHAAMLALEDTKNSLQWCLPKDVSSAPESSAMSLFKIFLFQKPSRKQTWCTHSHCHVAGGASVWGNGKKACNMSPASTLLVLFKTSFNR